jgi:hypothetical protein
VEYDIYFTEYDFCPVWSRVLMFTHCPIKLIYLFIACGFRKYENVFTHE